METTFTQAELMERWGYSKQTIINMEKDKKLYRLRRLPGVRYRAREVYELDGMSEEEREMMSPFERCRLIKERNYWRDRALNAESRMQKIALEAATYMKDEAMRQLKGGIEP